MKTNTTIGNIEFLERVCQNLQFEKPTYTVCFNLNAENCYFKHSSLFNHPIYIRHARINKKGKKVGYGDRYCIYQLATTKEIMPFSPKELKAIRAFFGL